MKRQQILDVIKYSFIAGCKCASSYEDDHCFEPAWGEDILMELVADGLINLDSFVDDSEGQRPYSESIQRIERFLVLADEADVIRCCDLEWETKYDLIFSIHIFSAIESLEFKIDYSSMGGSRKNDVNAYVNAVMDKAKELKPMVGQ